MLCLNVSAGIGVIGMASPMLQEVFGGAADRRRPAACRRSARSSKAQVATIAAAFAGLLSLFNIAGRFFWASLSDYIGRKVTYFIFFGLGIALYASAPSAGALREAWPSSWRIFCVILTMYGGGFATIPAYLADMFGTRFVGAIHGRLLTAWSTAGILGPVLVNYIQRVSDRPRDSALPGLQHHHVRAGSACCWLARSATSWCGRLRTKHFMTDEAAGSRAHSASPKCRWSWLFGRR